MIVTFVHGNKSIVIISFILLSAFASLSFHKLNEKKAELKLSMRKYEEVTSSLEESNNLVVKGTGL